MPSKIQYIHILPTSQKSSRNLSLVVTHKRRVFRPVLWTFYRIFRHRIISQEIDVQFRITLYVFKKLRDILYFLKNEKIHIHTFGIVEGSWRSRVERPQYKVIIANVVSRCPIAGYRYLIGFSQSKQPPPRCVIIKLQIVTAVLISKDGHYCLSTNKQQAIRTEPVQRSF